MEYVTVSLTNEQAKKLNDLCEFYGESNRGMILELALVKHHRWLFAEDRVEDREDRDLLALRLKAKAYGKERSKTVRGEDRGRQV